MPPPCWDWKKMNDTFIRAFVAIELPNEVKAQLAEEQKDLAAGLTGVKWVAPDGIHLTLKFLGNVAETRLGEIELALKRAVTGVPPFELRVGDRGAFPNSRRPEVVWLSVGGQTDRLTELFRNVENAMTELGWAPEARAFSPHLTLGRVRREAENEMKKHLAERLAKADDRVSAGFTVGSVSLMRSRLTPTGAVYSRLAEFPLKQ